MSVAFAGGEQMFRVTPGFLWAPFQRLEFRVELQATRYFGQGVVNADIFNLLSQVHVWF